MTASTKTVAVPAGVTAKRAASAAAASARFADALSGAKGAAAAVIVSMYGADVDTTAVRLAKRAADELSGAAKSRGGARADVLAVVNSVDGIDALTDSVFIAAARARLDANAAFKRERREAKQAQADVVNDSAATAEQRHAALKVLTGMDEQDSEAKRAAARQRFGTAAAAALEAGITADELTALVMSLAVSGI